MNKRIDQTNRKESIVFSWKPQDFNSLLKSCEIDDEVIFTVKNLKDKSAKILEAGCGLGRVVKYLHDNGYKNISGIEINHDSVVWLNKTFPELDIIEGDVLNLPYAKNSFDVILSYGVVEHFPDGPHAPLKAMYDILKPGGLGIVTVPSFTILRRIQYFFKKIDPRKNNFIRKLFGKKLLIKNRKKNNWYIDPQVGSFFEYRFTPKQFKKVLKQSGFEIVDSRPIGHIDGLFHCIGSPFVSFEDWKFTLSLSGKVLNYLFSLIPFFHNHMHLCVVKKTEIKNG